MEKLQKNLIVAAVLGSEAMDTAGEVLKIDGCDISTLPGGIVNTEHIGPADLEKEQDPEFKGFSTIVGKVLTAKKIFSHEDCENAMEEKAWNDLQVPLIFGTVELFDGIHDNATAATQIARKHPDLLGFSVEGQILKRNNHILAESIVNKVALTARPANRSSRIKGVLSDTKNPNDIVKSEASEGSLLRKTYFGTTSVVEDDFGLSLAAFKLKKALDAGMGTGAPGSLTQGAALQKESSKLAESIKHKPLTRSLLKKMLKNANNDQINKIYSHLKKMRLQKYEEESEQAFQEFSRKGK